MENIKLEPGRELDALIAEKVMGRKVYGDRISKPDPDIDIPECWLPKYSTDIAAAWAVVDALKKAGIEVVMLFRMDTVEGESWECGFKRMTLTTWKVFGDGGVSAPHAICLAALSALQPPTL